MKAYVLSILGIVLFGVIIDLIIPSGSTSKFIKSVYSIFVVMVIISPITNLVKTDVKTNLNDYEYELNTSIINYMFTNKVRKVEKEIEQNLTNEGFNGININLQFSIENDEIIYKKCEVDLKNQLINEDKQHINNYEFIKEVVERFVNIPSEDIEFYE